MLVQSRVRAASGERNADVRLDRYDYFATRLRTANCARALAFPAVQSASVADAARGDCIRCRGQTEIAARSICMAKWFQPRHGRCAGNSFGNCSLWRRLIVRPTASTSSAGQCERHCAGEFAVAERDCGDCKSSGEVRNASAVTRIGGVSPGRPGHFASIRRSPN